VNVTNSSLQKSSARPRDDRLDVHLHAVVVRSREGTLLFNLSWLHLGCFCGGSVLGLPHEASRETNRAGDGVAARLLVINLIFFDGSAEQYGS